MNRSITALVALSLLTLAASASAQEGSVSSTPERVGATRLRAGIGYWAGVSEIGVRGVGVLGASAQLGVQVDDRLALYVLGQGATVLLSNRATGALMAEWTFGEHVSVASGVGVEGANAYHYTLSFSGLTGSTGHWEDAVAVGVPLRASVNFGNAPAATDLFRNRFYIALDGFIGAEVIGRGALYPLAVSGGLSFGYQLM